MISSCSIIRICMYYAWEKVCNEGHKFIDGYFWVVEFLGFFVCFFINTSFNQVAQGGLEPIVSCLSLGLQCCYYRHATQQLVKVIYFTVQLQHGIYEWEIDSQTLGYHKLLTSVLCQFYSQNLCTTSQIFHTISIAYTVN